MRLIRFLRVCFWRVHKTPFERWQYGFLFSDRKCLSCVGSIFVRFASWCRWLRSSACLVLRSEVVRETRSVDLVLYMAPRIRAEYFRPIWRKTHSSVSSAVPRETIWIFGGRL